MAEIAFVIGNGFDIDMGLPSRYSDFIKCSEWKRVEHILDSFPENGYRDHSLIYHLVNAAYTETWFDIENEIHKFIVQHSILTEQEIREIKNEFDKIKTALTDYLKRVSKDLESKADKQRLSYQLLYNLQFSPMSKVEILFNYTNPDLFLEMPTYHEIGKGLFTYVHGSLRYNDIVLGCDLQKHEKVNRHLSFMYKYNMLNKANHVARHILEAKEIIFFGHSINEMDFCYFREFFRMASAAPQPIRHLTIITYDEEAERTIKDNIQNQGISVSDLYNNLWTFDFIHTQNVYAGKKEDVEKWNGMMARLMAKDRHGL